MDTHRLYQVLDAALADAWNASNYLRAWKTDQAPPPIAVLEGKLENSLTARLPPSMSRIAEKYVPTRNYGAELLERVRRVRETEDASLRTQMSHVLIQSIQRETGPAREARDALKKLDIKGPLAPEASATVRCTFLAPSMTIESAIDELKSVSQLMAALAECNGESMESPKVIGCSHGSPIDFSLQFGVSGSVDLLRLVILVVTIVKAPKIGSEALAMLKRFMPDKSDEEILKASAEANRKDLDDKQEEIVGRVENEARRNEVRGLLTRGVEYLEKSVDSGALEIEVDAPSVGAGESDDEIRQIRENGYRLMIPRTFDEEQVLLPPDSASQGSDVKGDERAQRQERRESQEIDGE